MIAAPIAFIIAISESDSPNGIWDLPESKLGSTRAVHSRSKVQTSFR
jgi:hypothetical protein